MTVIGFQEKWEKTLAFLFRMNHNEFKVKGNLQPPKQIKQ